MSLEQAIQDNTKVLQSIATSLAVLAAQGKLNPTNLVAPVEAAPVATPAATEVKRRPAATPAKEKALADKTDKEIIDQVIAEEEAAEADIEVAADEQPITELDPFDDIPDTDEPSDLPKLPAGERTAEFASLHVKPMLTKLGRDQVIALLARYNKATRITEVPTDKWEELLQEAFKMLRSVGKV